MSNKNLENQKVSNTAKADKRNKLEVKSGTHSVIDIHGKSINLSDILRTTEYDNSEYHNLLDEENISSELVSLSQNERENSNQLQNEFSSQNFSSLKTPNFPNKAQSKIALL